MGEELFGRPGGNRSSLVPLQRRLAPVQEYDSSREESFSLDHDGREAPSGGGLANLLRVLLKWRWLFLSIVMISVLAGALLAFLTTPLYKAEATLELNPTPAKVVQLGEPLEAQTSDRDFLALQVGLIKSRAVAERVARNLSLRVNPAFTGSTEQAPSNDAVVGTLLQNLSASGTTSDRLMKISYTHPDPAVAAQVATGFAQALIESTMERQVDSTSYARKYLQQRLAATREKLEASEAALMGYARRANILNIVSSEGASSTEAAGSSLAASNLMALNAQLAEAQNARIAAQQRYEQAGGAAAAAALSNSAVQALEQQKAQLQSEYQKGLETFGPEYPQMAALRGQIEAVDRQIAAARSRTSSATSGALRAEYTAAVNRERQLEAKINQLQSRVMDLGDRSIQYNILKRDVEANRELYNALLQRLKEEDTSATKSSNLAIVDAAQIPGAPFTPNIPRSITLALLLGIALGTGAAFAAEYLEDTITLPDDLPNRLNIAVLGVVPRVGKKESVDDELLLPASSVSEAYYSVRTALQFSTSHGLPKTLFFTSTRAGEGKTSSSLAIARNLADLGIKVVLVDADLRNPSLLQETRTKAGLASVLTGNSLLEETLVLTETPNLYLLPAGPTPPNPANILASNALRRVLAELSEAFDAVVVDGPPVLGLADAPLIASACEATVLVCESGKTRRAVALNALSRLQLGGANIVGGILTKFSNKAVGYGYGYGYGGHTYSYQYGKT